MIAIVSEHSLTASRYQFEVANVAEAHLMTDTALKLCEAHGDEFLFLKSYAYGVRTLLWLEHNDGQKGYLHAGIWVGIEGQLFERTKRHTGQYAAAYNAMGVACAKCGLFAKAKVNLYKSKEIRESIEGFKVAHNFSPFRELGRIAIAQGDYEEGKDILTRALKDREADLGVGDKVSERLDHRSHPSTGIKLSNRTGTLYCALGNAYEGLREDGESYQYHDRALKQLQATAGLSHPITGMALYKVAGHSMKFGQTFLPRAL